VVSGRLIAGMKTPRANTTLGDLHRATPWPLRKLPNLSGSYAFYSVVT
jgi:hypothetical protein